MGNLRNRAAGNEVATVDDDKKNEAARLEVMRGEIARMEEQFQLAMPKGAEATQLVRDAVTAIRANPQLAKCEPKSVLGSLMTCAQLGLRVGVLGHAWVLPFWDKRSQGFKAQLIIGYQGLVELAHRSGKVSSLIARTVHEKDTFDVSYGLDDNLVHKPFMDGDRGAPIAYYAVVKLTSGGRAFMVMTKREAEAHRDNHAMAKMKNGTIVGPWRDDFDAMAMKTCVIKLAKWMPKSTDLARAIEVDEGVRVDLTPDRQPEEATHHYRTSDTIDGEVEEAPADSPPAKNDAAAQRTPTVPQLHAEIAAAGEARGMDAMALESNFAQQNADGDIREASVDQLGAFLQWVEAQTAPAAPDEPSDEPSGPSEADPQS